MSLDWDKIESDNNKGFKDYAPEGIFKTKIEKVVLKEAGTGSKGIEFKLADNADYKFPKYGAVAWLSSKNPGWRQHHMKELFVLLGFTEDQARKAVEVCEDKEDLGKAYLTAFEKALPKSKEVEIEVFYKDEDSQYTTWDFTSSKVRMNKPEKSTKPAKKEEVLEDAVELSSEEATDLPF